MAARYSNVAASITGSRLEVSFDLESEDAALLGWQLYDPDTQAFLWEGEWQPVSNGRVALSIEVPQEPGRYRFYVSPLDCSGRWLFARRQPFVLIDAEVGPGGEVGCQPPRVTTLASLRGASLPGALTKAFTYPVRSIRAHWPLISSLVRRDVLARYRGSFAGIFWTVLNPLLLMLTYFFVFGLVLRTRFGEDGSRSAFTLYFLAGMLPWLAFVEPAGRAPNLVLEHRSFVKKVVFPVEILPVIPVLAGLVTELFALAIFLPGLLVARGAVPVTALALPLLIVPQVLFTMGVSWFFAALGVFIRDLGQVIGFLLTLWFFLTPICYPESALPAQALAVLGKNPIFWLVRGYRDLLLEGRLPDPGTMALLWAAGIAAAVLGHAWFYKLRKSFADAI
jgi:lipopolysaccharide transport system permease protein